MVRDYSPPWKIIPNTPLAQIQSDSALENTGLANVPNPYGPVNEVKTLPLSFTLNLMTFWRFKILNFKSVQTGWKWWNYALSRNEQLNRNNFSNNSPNDSKRSSAV